MSSARESHVFPMCDHLSRTSTHVEGIAAPDNAALSSLSNPLDLAAWAATNAQESDSTDDGTWTVTNIPHN